MLESGHHGDFEADEQDVIPLQSLLCDYESFFLRDGCTGIAVFGNSPPMEIQFDEHKCLILYPGNEQRMWHFVGFLRQWGLREEPEMECIYEIDHIHFSSNKLQRKFHELCSRLRAEE